MRPIGMRAQDSLRLEKGYGVWSLEFTASYTPAMAGLDRFVAFDKGEFIGRDGGAARARRGARAAPRAARGRRAATPTSTGYEPVCRDGRRVGYVTSGAYGHHVRQSLALAYVERAVADAPGPLEVQVVGESRPARILARAAIRSAGTAAARLDGDGSRLRLDAIIGQRPAPGRKGN